MRPSEFPDDVIITAGKDLVAAGRNVTGFALRTKLGGGNAARLKQVWDEHKAKATATQEAAPAELPHEVAEALEALKKEFSDRLVSLVAHLNDTAIKTAERRVAEVVRAAGEQREQANRELADAAQTVEDLEAVLEAAKTSNDEMGRKFAEAQATTQAQAIEIAALKERLEQATREVQQLTGRASSAEAERDAARTQASEARELVAKLTGQVEACEKHCAELTAALGRGDKPPRPK
jgi:colicin import membrane protein